MLKQTWPVQLKQFGHQVGGHSLLLELTKDKVCKFLLPREHFFYSSIPQEISQFVPEYHGRLQHIHTHMITLLVVLM